VNLKCFQDNKSAYGMFLLKMIQKKKSDWINRYVRFLSLTFNICLSDKFKKKNFEEYFLCNQYKHAISLFYR